MKKLVPVLMLIIIGFSLVLGTLWVLQKNRRKPKVIKIYKVTLHQPNPITPAQIEQPNSSSSAAISTHATTKDVNDVDNPSLTTEYSLSPEEEIAFWDWLLTLAEVIETEDAMQKTPKTEEKGEFELTNGEIRYLVLKEYQLLDILSAYGVTFNPYNWTGTCPICETPDEFQVMRNGSTGNPDYWCCLDPSCGDNGDVYYPYDLIDFVAQMEGMERYEAARHLAKRAGLLE